MCGCTASALTASALYYVQMSCAAGLPAGAVGLPGAFLGVGGVFLRGDGRGVRGRLLGLCWCASAGSIVWTCCGVDRLGGAAGLWASAGLTAGTFFALVSCARLWVFFVLIAVSSLPQATIARVEARSAPFCAVLRFFENFSEMIAAIRAGCSAFCARSARSAPNQQKKSAFCALQSTVLRRMAVFAVFVSVHR